MQVSNPGGSHSLRKKVLLPDTPQVWDGFGGKCIHPPATFFSQRGEGGMSRGRQMMMPAWEEEALR